MKKIKLGMLVEDSEYKYIGPVVCMCDASFGVEVRGKAGCWEADCSEPSKVDGSRANGELSSVWCTPRTEGAKRIILSEEGGRR